MQISRTISWYLQYDIVSLHKGLRAVVLHTLLAACHSISSQVVVVSTVRKATRYMPYDIKYDALVAVSSIGLSGYLDSN